MQEVKVIARYRDGRMVKGHTNNFAPNQPVFHVLPVGDGDHQAIEIWIAELKAIFIVRDFEGDPDHVDSTEGAGSVGGRNLRVTFTDGETLSGWTMEYNPGGAGFWMFPLDPLSNNQRIFVVNASVDRVEPITHTEPAKRPA